MQKEVLLSLRQEGLTSIQIPLKRLLWWIKALEENLEIQLHNEAGTSMYPCHSCNKIATSMGCGPGKIYGMRETKKQP
jgi:hypothetical protein